MPWHNQPGNGNANSPWGSNNNGSKGNGPRNPWGSGPQGGGHGGGGPHHQQPDLDDMLRKAQDSMRDMFPGGMKNGSVFLLGFLILIAVWLSSGLYTIEPGIHGVVQRFGALERTRTEEGLAYHLPWPVETVTKVNINTIREMEIGFIDTASRNGKTKIDIPEESLMLTADANIVDLDMVVQWDIKSASDYLFNIYDPEGTVKKVAESAIREIVGQTSMFPIITTERATVAERARDIMSKNLDEYHSGINIRQVLIQEAEVHPDVQKAFQDVQSAKQDAEDVQNRAEAYREDILPRARGEAIKMIQQAEGYKQSVTAKAQGDAERFNSVYAAYKTGKDITRKRIYLETMESVLSNAQKIILDENGEGSGVVPYLPLNELKPASGKK